MKTCTKCRESKSESEFCKSARGAGGLYSQCKSCTQADQRAWRARNAEHYSAYCAERYANHAPTKAQKITNARAAYEKQPEAKRARQREYARKNPHINARHVARYPEREAARRAARRAVKSGKLVRQLCEKCGSTNAHAHHPDYSKPLFVQWLCRKHHGELHRIKLNTDFIAKREGGK